MFKLGGVGQEFWRRGRGCETIPCQHTSSALVGKGVVSPRLEKKGWALGAA